MKAAIIGCGKIGSVYSDLVLLPGVYSHAHAYKDHPDIELVAVVDPDARKARACAERWGVPWAFSDHREMLAQAQPEIVSICSPNATHVAIGLDVVRHPSVRGVICEKPLALDSDGARQLDDAATQNGKLLLVNYSRRFDGAYDELRAQLHAGVLGSVKAVTGWYGKGLFHNGTHWLDLIRFLFGEPNWVQGYPSGFAHEDDETYSLALALDGGTVAMLHGMDHATLTVFEVDIVGTKGRVRLHDGGRTISHYGVVESGFIEGANVLSEAPASKVGALSNALPMMVANLVAGLARGEELRCTGRDGLAAVLLAEAVRESARSRARVRLG